MTQDQRDELIRRLQQGECSQVFVIGGMGFRHVCSPFWNDYALPVHKFG